MEGLKSDALAFLVQPQPMEEFMKKNWEQCSVHCGVHKVRAEAVKDVMSMKDFSSILVKSEEEGRCLKYFIDVCAMQYKDGRRRYTGGKHSEIVENGTAEKLYSEGATFQVHQPQRFNDKLWQLCAALESQLGCLVGCNAYITPPNSQGLAPHWDGVSLFVVQTSGSKKWKVYGPMKDREYSYVSSTDIRREQLPDVQLEVTLHPGDVLYIPRGHIHEAQALEDGSSHVTLSSYENWTWSHITSLLHHSCHVLTLNAITLYMVAQLLGEAKTSI